MDRGIAINLNIFTLNVRKLVLLLRERRGLPATHKKMVSSHR